jgi:hypothetical protein
MNEKKGKLMIALWMMETLVNEGVLQKEQVLAQADISDISFKRYIASLREYCFEFHPTWQILYTKASNHYVLGRNDSLA